MGIEPTTSCLQSSPPAVQWAPVGSGEGRMVASGSGWFTAKVLVSRYSTVQ